MLTSDDNSAVAAALVGDMTASYPPTSLPTPTSAPATPADTPAAAASTPSTSGNTGLSITPSHGSSSNGSSAHPDELLDIKQQALTHLSPLVDHLEQSASDRFRTTMMMIQASDNASLIKSAYDAALQISDDKERAQALLDLINEINYFTQQNKNNSNAS
jgi:hypothetical protein